MAISKEELVAATYKYKNPEIQNKTHGAFIVGIEDEVLIEVSGEITALGIWEKLETLYMKKSLDNRLYLKKELFTHQMDE